MKIRKLVTSIACVLLVVTMMFPTNTVAYADVEKLINEKNTSESIYHWKRVKSVEDILAIVADGENARNKEFRALLIPEVLDGIFSDGMGYDHYCIVDDDDDELSDIYFSDNPDIAYDEEQFYTRGGFRAPYLVYEGLNETKEAIKAFGEAVPSFRIYEAGQKDEKTSELLIQGAFCGEDPAQYVWSESALNELDLEEEGYIWEIGFPKAHESTYVSKQLKEDGFETERKFAAESVCIGAYVEDRDCYYWIADDVPASPADWVLMSDEGRAGAYYREITFKLFIGVKEEAEVIDGTVTVGAGQTKVIDEVALIKDGSCLKVEKGGTLFISGYCVNNGILLLEGGTVVVQKGAIIAPMSPQKKTKWTGEITVNAGNLIIREGACVANFTPGINCSMVARNDGQIINRGIIASHNDIWVEDRGLLHNQGFMYMGVKLKLGESLPTYNKQMGISIKEYANQAPAKFEKKIDAAGRSSYVCNVRNETTGLKGIFKNEGSYRRY